VIAGDELAVGRGDMRLKIGGASARHVVVADGDDERWLPRRDHPRDFHLLGPAGAEITDDGEPHVAFVQRRDLRARREVCAGGRRAVAGQWGGREQRDEQMARIDRWHPNHLLT